MITVRRHWQSPALMRHDLDPAASLFTAGRLEHLAPMLDNRILSDWIRAKAGDPQAREWDWEQYVDDNGGAVNARLEQRWNTFSDSKAPGGEFAS